MPPSGPPFAARARWGGELVAYSERAIELDGNVYFPPEDVDDSRVRPSPTRTICPWKGVAHYWDVVVGDAVNSDAGWSYPTPSPQAEPIRGHVAFWRGVAVERDLPPPAQG